MSYGHCSSILIIIVDSLHVHQSAYKVTRGRMEKKTIIKVKNFDSCINGDFVILFLKVFVIKI